MVRTFIHISGLLAVMLGLALIFCAGSIYLGPDIEFLLQQGIGSVERSPIAGLSGIASGIAGGQVQQTPAPAHVPFAPGSGKAGARLVIPRMQLDASISEATWTTNNNQGRIYTDWVLPYQSIGHLANTVNPGEAGNMILSGHNNLVGPNQFGVGLFAGLWNLKPGDPVYVYDQAGRTFEYQVTQSYPMKEVGEPLSVLQQQWKDISAYHGTPETTLVTCWNGPVAPLSGNSYRWIVSAKLVGEVDPAQVPQVHK